MGKRYVLHQELMAILESTYLYSQSVVTHGNRYVQIVQSSCNLFVTWSYGALDTGKLELFCVILQQLLMQPLLR